MEKEIMIKIKKIGHQRIDTRIICVLHLWKWQGQIGSEEKGTVCSVVKRLFFPKPRDHLKGIIMESVEKVLYRLMLYK